MSEDEQKKKRTRTRAGTVADATSDIFAKLNRDGKLDEYGEKINGGAGLPSTEWRKRLKKGGVGVDVIMKLSWHAEAHGYPDFERDEISTEFIGLCFTLDTGDTLGPHLTDEHWLPDTGFSGAALYRCEVGGEITRIRPTNVHRLDGYGFSVLNIKPSTHQFVLSRTAGYSIRKVYVLSLADDTFTFRVGVSEDMMRCDPSDYKFKKARTVFSDSVNAIRLNLIGDAYRLRNVAGFVVPVEAADAELGAPVIDGESGVVVGIVIARSDEGETGLAVDIRTVKELFDYHW